MYVCVCVCVRACVCVRVCACMTSHCSPPSLVPLSRSLCTARIVEQYLQDEEERLKAAQASAVSLPAVLEWTRGATKGLLIMAWISLFWTVGFTKLVRRVSHACVRLHV